MRTIWQVGDYTHFSLAWVHPGRVPLQVLLGLPDGFTRRLGAVANGNRQQWGWA